MAELFTRSTQPSAQLTIFVFPPAGSSAGAFQAWRKLLPSSVDFRVLALPGRERRIAERPDIDISAIADAVSGTNRPYVFYGHSLGGLIAFEVTRELRRRSGRMPESCYFGASRPAHLRDALISIATVPDDEFVAAVKQHGGVPPGVLDDPELRELLLPALRYDVKWLHDYQHAVEEPVDVPFVSIAGDRDAMISPELMVEWQRHTSVPLRSHVVSGDHFFFQSAAAAVTALIAADLSPSVDLVPLPGTEWHVWSSALLRAAGFPADGLDRLAAPDCANVADSHLDGQSDRDAFLAAFDKAAQSVGAELVGIAADPLFREAVTWQNPGAMTALDKLAATDLDRPGNSKRREREKIVARYWSRYCGKNESIGFFGPVKWINVGDTSQVQPGPGLVRRRVVNFEWWALTAFVDHYAADPAVRAWFPLTRQPHHELRGGVLLRPAHPPLRLNTADTAVLSHCDGRPAGEVARLVCAAVDSGPRKPDDVYLIADRLARQDLLRWRLDLPLDLTAEGFLRDWIDRIGDDTVRRRVSADIARLTEARGRVASAAGDADKLFTAMADLDAEFQAVTGLEPRQRAGETYAGRKLCYEDTERDLDLTIGEPVLAALAEPLDVMLHAARWLTVAVADAYRDAFRQLYRELGGEQVSLGDLWFLAYGLLYGEGERPVDVVTAEFGRRWSSVLGLDKLDSRVRRVELTSAEVKARALEAFAAEAPGWQGARLHSPDLTICAAGPEELQRGEFTAVLGELHAAWLTCSSGFFVDFHPDRAALLAAVRRDLGLRTVPLYPANYPTLTARLADVLIGPGDLRVGHVPAPVWQPGQVLPIAGLVVSEKDGELVATAPDGRCWPLVELFSGFLSAFAVDAYKVAGSGDRTPRVTIDRLTVARETWRTTIGATGLATVDAYPDRYLAARRLCRRLGLPDRVFAKVGTEIKPCYVDLTSPVSISAFCTMLRTARLAGGDDVPVTITELLPAPDQAWVPDAQGRRYFSEVRLTVRDPRSPR